MHMVIHFLLLMLAIAVAIGIVAACNSGGDDDDDDDDDESSGCDENDICERLFEIGCEDAFGYDSVEECVQDARDYYAECNDPSGYQNCQCTTCWDITNCTALMICDESCWAQYCE